MRDLLLDVATHDLVAGSDLALTGPDDQAVAQHIKQRLLTLLGEWFLDQSVGLPLFDNILGKHRNMDIVEALYRDCIMGTPMVKTLTHFELTVPDGNSRTSRLDFTVSLSDGSALTVGVAL